MNGLALTFDDGPDPVWTARLLSLLARLAAPATFFPIAPRAAAAPGLIERALGAGHTIGLHCDEHVRHSDRDAAWLRRDTGRAIARLRRVGVTPALWRTPWGDRTAGTDAVAAEHGLRVIGWSFDTHDWRGDRAEDMFTAFRDALHPGMVVLAHDGLGPGARRAGAEETLRFVALAVAHARREGLPVQALA